MLAQGAHQRVVMEILGHSQISMTSKYAHVLPQVMTDAAERIGRYCGATRGPNCNPIGQSSRSCGKITGQKWAPGARTQNPRIKGSRAALLAPRPTRMPLQSRKLPYRSRPSQASHWRIHWQGQNACRAAQPSLVKTSSLVDPNDGDSPYSPARTQSLCEGPPPDLRTWHWDQGGLRWPAGLSAAGSEQSAARSLLAASSATALRPGSPATVTSPAGRALPYSLGGVGTDDDVARQQQPDRDIGCQRAAGQGRIARFQDEVTLQGPRRPRAPFA